VDFCWWVSSAFTRNPNGTGRGDFAFANELGLPHGHAWPDKLGFQSNHYQAIQPSAREPFAGRGADMAYAILFRRDVVGNFAKAHQFLRRMMFWRAACERCDRDCRRGMGWPFLTVKPFGKGFFIYTAAFSAVNRPRRFCAGNVRVRGFQEGDRMGLTKPRESRS